MEWERGSKIKHRKASEIQWGKWEIERKDMHVGVRSVWGQFHCVLTGPNLYRAKLIWLQWNCAFKMRNGYGYAFHFLQCVGKVHRLFVCIST